jgi:hypothetical protein
MAARRRRNMRGPAIDSLKGYSWAFQLLRLMNAETLKTY